MSVNKEPIFVKTGIGIPQPIAAANTSSDGSGALVNLVTAGADGALITAVQFRNAQITPAASTAMVVRVFLSDASGANFQIIGEAALATATRSSSAVGATVTITPPMPILMKAGQVLAVAQSVYAGAQDRNAAVAFGGSYTA